MYIYACKSNHNICKRAQITYFAIIITNVIVTHRNAR